MSEHVPKSQIERFAVSALPEHELATIGKHLAECEGCHQAFSDTLRRQRGTEGIKFTLAPEFWLRHDHLDYERLVAFAENKLDAAEREVVNVHLSTCESCRVDVSSFLAFRQQIEPELQVRYGPSVSEGKARKVSLSSWWVRLSRKPIYGAAVVIIGIALMIAAILLLKRRASNLEAK